MRNLKKILALALALIMSLSLMMTASAATTFKDDESINDTYRLAVEVLNGLEVLKGDDNGFRPGDTITRAEVAAIIYRITTGDVTDARVGNFTPYGQFSDVNDGSWYAGYVTYSANAGYIKGVGNGKFNPNNNVTGYEVLTMILRTVGYDKADNEFTGPDWQLHVASTAQELGILDKCANVHLGDDARRQEVAEMIFRAILLPKVEYSIVTRSYTQNDERVADVLKLEEIEGVVVANEWAALDADTPLAEGKTKMMVDNAPYTLAISTEIDDIGESRSAYVQDKTTVLAIDDSGKNEVKYNEGKEMKVSTLADNLSTKDAEHFRNFGDFNRKESDWQLRWTVTFKNATAAANFAEWYENVEEAYQAELASNLVDADKITRTVGGVATSPSADLVDGNYPVTYNKVIRANTEIHDYDLDIMQGIFASGASTDDTDVDNGIEGFVYAGTTLASITNNNTATSAQIVSNDHTYKQFYNEYIGDGAKKDITEVARGNWLKIVDNDGDGSAEYVLSIEYVLDEIVAYSNRDEIFSFESDLNTDPKSDTFDGFELSPLGDYTPEVGDVVIYANIDGNCYIELADSKTVTVDKYDWRTDTVTTTEDEEYLESGIDNETEYSDDTYLMDSGEEYIVYFDKYNNIRAFRLTDTDRHYGLLTDMWLTRNSNTNFIKTETAKAELSIPNESGSGVSMKEYEVANHTLEQPNVFVGIQQQAGYGESGDTDNLQRAMAHLGLASRYTSSNSLAGMYADGRTESGATYGPTNKVSQYGGSTLGAEFDYDNDSRSVDATQTGTIGINTNTNITYSSTNVAKYKVNEDGTVNLETAAEYAENKSGQRIYYSWKDGTVTTDAKTDNKDNISVYAYDYVMLDATKDITAGQQKYAIASNYVGANSSSAYVDAVRDTEVYIVSPGGVFYDVGRSTVPSIDADNIRAIYALAENTNRDSNDRDYWLANVLVIELESDLEGLYSHVIYNIFDNVKSTRAALHIMTAIDGVTGNVIEVTITDNWNREYPSGFYVLDNDAVVDGNGNISASSAKAIPDYSAYNANRIYAGTLERVKGTTVRDTWLTVDDGVDPQRTVGVYGTKWYGLDETSTGVQRYVEIESADYRDIEANGHEIIWVEDGNGNAVFIIDTDFTSNDRLEAPDFIHDIYDDIMEEQEKNDIGAADVTVTGTINGEAEIDLTEAVGGDDGTGWVTISKTALNSAVDGDPDLTGYTVAALRITKGEGVAYETSREDSSGLYLYKVKGSVEVEAILTTSTGADTLTVTQDGSSAGAPTNVKYSENGSATTTDLAINNATGSIDVGTLLEITFTAPNDATGYYVPSGGSMTAAKKGEVGASTTTWSFTMHKGTGAENVAVGYTTDTYYAVELDTKSADLKTSSSVKDGATLGAAGAASIILTGATAGHEYEVTGLRMGATTLVKGTDYTWTTGSGTITLKGSKEVTGPITVSAEIIPSDMEVEVELYPVAETEDEIPESVKYGGGFEINLTASEGWSSLSVGNMDEIGDKATVTLVNGKLTVSDVVDDITISIIGVSAAQEISAATALLNNKTLTAFEGDSTSASLTLSIQRQAQAILKGAGYSVLCGTPTLKAGTTGETAFGSLTDGGAHDVVYEVPVGDDGDKANVTISIKDTDYAALKALKDAFSGSAPTADPITTCTGGSNSAAVDSAVAAVEGMDAFDTDSMVASGTQKSSAATSHTITVTVSIGAKDMEIGEVNVTCDGTGH